MSDDELVEACPNCDAAARHRRREEAPPEERFRCRECGHTFAEPEKRPPKPNVGGLSPAGQAAVAWSADDEGGEA